MTATPARLAVREVTREVLPGEAAALLGGGYAAVLVAGHDDRVRYVFARPATHPDGEDRVELSVAAPDGDAWVPTLAALSFPLSRFEREVRDLYGITPRDHPLPHRLVRHAHWPTGWYPMRSDAGEVPAFDEDASTFPFLEVGGDGVYEIPVGPVHAGMIEPGHFRFSVVGETIVRMKARLWYVHRGVEKLFEGRAPRDGIELAERISGDTAVGHTVAYVMACEEALGIEVDDRARAARALLLELERIYNHVNDLGAILNDVAFGIAQQHAQHVRETLLRLNSRVTGHRLLRGAIGVGSTDLRELPDLTVVSAAAERVAEIVRIAVEHPMVADRLVGPGALGEDDARRMGVLGYVARASGLADDARRDHPFLALTTAAGDEFTPVVEHTGDVLGRFLVRAREVAASATLVAVLAEHVVDGGDATAASGEPSKPLARKPIGPASGTGLGIVEAWRGRLCHRVQVRNGTLTRVKVVDPSFMNWPALPISLRDTIVPDFPLVNKSFNASYAGNDL